MTGHTILASVLRNQSRADEAIEYSSALVGALDESGRDSHYLMSDFLRLHGQVLTDLERFKDSESALLRAWELKQSASDEPADAGVIRSAITELYERWFAVDRLPEIEDKLAQWK